MKGAVESMFHRYTKQSDTSSSKQLIEFLSHDSVAQLIISNIIQVISKSDLHVSKSKMNTWSL